MEVQTGEPDRREHRVGLHVMWITAALTEVIHRPLRDPHNAKQTPRGGEKHERRSLRIRAR